MADRKHKSTGVHDDPYASVVLIKANKTVVIISLDLVYGDRSFAYGIKKAINERYGLEHHEVIINYSHTHSVVSVTGEDEGKRVNRAYSISQDNFTWGKDKEDIDYTEDIKYYNMIKMKIINMLDEGFKNLIEGDAYICRGASGFGVSRRYPSEEGIQWKPNFDENCIDTDLYLVKFVDKAGNIHGLIYNYACHPTTLGSDNYLISADFPGAVRKCFEEKNGKFKSCSYEELEQAGASLAKEIEDHIEKSKWRRIYTDIKTAHSEIKLYTETWDVNTWESIANSSEEPLNITEPAKRNLLDIKKGRINNSLTYFISYLELDNKTCIICLENEVVSDIGKMIKKVLSDKDAIVLGYSNSSMCYIPTRKITREGGYESRSFISARLSGPFVPEIEDIIIGRAVAMAKGEELALV